MSLLERYESMRRNCLAHGNLHPDSKEVCHQAIAKCNNTLAHHMALLLDDMAIALGITGDGRGEAVAWKHACNALCVDGLELWIDRCPHCGKPAPQQQQAAPGDDSSEVWPIVNLDVAEDGTISNAKLYAPGLPAGNHDVYPVRVPYMDEHTEAWLAVSAAIEKVRPGFLLQDGKNGIECAVSAIQSLAASGARDDLLKRVEDLHEKAGMPWAEAEKLALSEAGIDDCHIDELTGNTEHSTIVSLLSDEDVREFVRTVLIYGQPLIAAAPKPQEPGA